MSLRDIFLLILLQWSLVVSGPDPVIRYVRKSDSSISFPGRQLVSIGIITVRTRAWTGWANIIIFHKTLSRMIIAVVVSGLLHHRWSSANMWTLVSGKDRLLSTLVQGFLQADLSRIGMTPGDHWLMMIIICSFWLPTNGSTGPLTVSVMMSFSVMSMTSSTLMFPMRTRCRWRWSMVFHMWRSLNLSGVKSDRQVFSWTVQPLIFAWTWAVLLDRTSFTHRHVSLFFFLIFIWTRVFMVDIIHRTSGMSRCWAFTHSDILSGGSQRYWWSSLKLLLGLHQKSFNLLRRHFLRQLANDFHATFRN